MSKKPIRGRFVVILLAISSISGFLIGWISGQESQRSPAGCVKVKVIELCHDNNGDGKRVGWTLVETPDKQRCGILDYRGGEGSRFVVRKTDLNGYLDPGEK